MIILFGIVAVIGIAFLLGINFYPPLKAKWAKWSVVIEGIVATAIYWFGQVSDALHQAQAAGYIPDRWLGYLPYVFLVYLLIKQVQGALSNSSLTRGGSSVAK